MIRLASVVALLAASPLPVTAQENSVGFIYTPNLSMHDESTCCSAAGAWITIGRLHVEHVVGWDSHWQKRAVEWDFPEGTTPEKVDGHVLTALWTLRSWQTPRFRTRFQAGGRYAAPLEPTEEPWGFGAGLTVDYLVGPGVLHGAFRFLLPATPEFRLGIGLRF